MTATLVRPIWLATALAACTTATGSTEQTSDVPATGLASKMYPLANSSLTPLAPVNSVTKDIGTIACVTKADGSQPDVGDFFKQDARSVAYVEYARSRSQVDDALSTKISASFSTPFAAASAEVEASTEASVRGESIYLVGELVAFTNQVLASTCPITLTENATEVLLDDSAFGEVPAAELARYRAAAFMRICGDGWTHTRLMGAGGTLILEFKSKGSSSKNAIRAELSAGFGNRLYGAKIGAAVSASKTKLASESTFKATLVTRGAIAGMPDAGDVDADPGKLTDMVKKLDELVNVLKEPGGNVNNLSPMAARLAAYNGLPPWQGWSQYDATKRGKLRASLELIKPLAEEMEKYLGLRANLVKELDAIQAQIKTIREVYPVHFNYDGTSQWNFAGTAILPTFGTTADYADVALYKTRFETLSTRLKDEMKACVDSGNAGYIKCKPSTALPSLVARDIVKWRTNRPKKFVAYLAPFASSSATAADQCNTYDGGGGRPLVKAEAKFVRAYCNVHLAAGADGHRKFWLGDPMAGETCDGGAVAHSRVYDATDGTFLVACGQPHSKGTLCIPKTATSMWDDGYWRDELDLTALGL